jgi:hypothetical protein
MTPSPPADDLKNTLSLAACRQRLKTLVPGLFGDELPTFEDVTVGKFFDEMDSTTGINSATPAPTRLCAPAVSRFNLWFDAFLPKHRYIVEQVESPRGSIAADEVQRHVVDEGHDPQGRRVPRHGDLLQQIRR